MKKTLVVFLSVLFVLSMAMTAFAVHPSTPSEMVSIGAKGKTQIVLGGSLRFRGDWRKDRILPNADPLTMQFAAGAIDEITPFALAAGVSQAEIDAFVQNGIGNYNDSVVMVDPISGAITPAITSGDLIDLLIDAGVDSDDAIDLVDAFDDLGLTSAILFGGLTSTEKNNAFYDMRVRLWLDAYVSDNTMGRIQLETGSNNGTDGDAWGCDGARDNSGIYPFGNCKKDELRVLEAYIKHEGSGLLGIPAGIKIGHFPVKLGRGLFFLHNRLGDDVINLYADLSDNFHAELAYIKHEERGTANMDGDADSYTLIAGYTNSNFNINGDVTYLRDKAWPTKEGTDLWNIGVRGNVDVGFNIYADVEFQTGSADDATIDLVTGLPEDLDFGGYAVVVGADFTIGGPAIDLNAEFGMGSGDDDPLDSDYDAFVTTLSGVQKFTYVYEYRVMSAALGTNTGISNTTYLKVGASGSPSPDLKAGIEFYYLQATEDVLGEDDIGFEIDGRMSYKIDTNLEYFIEGGVLFAGDMYDVFADGGDADDMYVVRHGVQLAF